jgi:cytochrome c peroxidase
MRSLVPSLAAVVLGGVIHAVAGPVRADTPQHAAMVEAGRRLFFDVRLSEPPGTSCASCHDPTRAFTGDNGSGLAVPRGSRAETRGTRNSPTLMYLATSPGPGFAERDGKSVPRGGFFWDGRARSLSEQVLGPLFTAHEMNNRDASALAAKVATSDAAPWLRRAFGENVFAEPDRVLSAVTRSLAAFEQSPDFAQFSSKFDAVLRGRARLTEQEQRGQSLFTIAQKGNCAACHTLASDSSDPRDSLFTDFEFHAVGVPRNVDIARPGSMDLGYCDALPEAATDRLRWCGWFKTPTLRNVAVTAPYMHNGMFANLRQVIDYYDAPDKVVPAALGRDVSMNAQLNLSEQDKRDLEQFLIALTDDRFLAASGDKP